MTKELQKIEGEVSSERSLAEAVDDRIATKPCHGTFEAFGYRIACILALGHDGPCSNPDMRQQLKALLFAERYASVSGPMSIANEPCGARLLVDFSDERGIVSTTCARVRGHNGVHMPQEEIDDNLRNLGSDPRNYRRSAKIANFDYMTSEEIASFVKRR